MVYNLDVFQEVIKNSTKIAILSGAGVSTSSGIRDFRGENGLYTEKVFGLDPEKILSRRFFDTYRDLFYKYYVHHMSIPDGVEPNTIHLLTKRLADENKLVGVVTQNIDGLYQKTGLPEELLVEIHGNGTRWICTKCKQPTLLSEARLNGRTGNYLSSCHQFLIRPDIVLYDEEFDAAKVKQMKQIYQDAEVLIVMGTSLNIIPHLESVQKFRGKIILMNHKSINLGTRDWDAAYIGNIEDSFMWD